MQKKTKIDTCKCQSVEVLSQVTNEFFKGKVIQHKQGQLYCKLCHSKLITAEKIALFCHIDTFASEKIQILPDLIKSECQHFTEKFSQTDILISRQRQYNLPIYLSKNTFFIDTDFFWSFLPAYLCAVNNDNIITIVTSNRTLRQALQSVWISKLINKNL